MRKILFTCKDGLDLKNTNDEFWAWEDDELACGGVKFSIDESYLKEEDEGLYSIIDARTFELINE